MDMTIVDPREKIKDAPEGIVKWWKDHYDEWDNGTITPFVQPDYSAIELPEPIAYNHYTDQSLTPEQVEELIEEEEAAEASITLSGG